jgi:hypothetical protein
MLLADQLIEGAPAAARGPPVEYHLTAESIPSLDRFEGSPLLAEGRLSLIGLDAIVDRLAHRWPLRRDQVYDMVERTLERRLDDDAFLARVSERDYLVVQPSRDRDAGQALCLRCLRELLDHFLGDASDAQLKVYAVIQVSRHGIEASPLDPTRIARQAADAETRSFAPANDEVAKGPAYLAQFALSTSRPVRVEPTLEPVLCLTTGSIIGHRIVRRVVAQATNLPLTAIELERLARSDVERIDTATIAGGIAQLEQLGDRRRAAALIAPLSFASIANPRGRSIVTSTLAQARERVDIGVICEVLDLEGAPFAPLAEGLALIAPACLFSVAHLREPQSAESQALRACGFHGVSIDAPTALATDMEFLEWARKAVTPARRIAKSVLVYGVTNLRRTVIAATAGATHTSAPPDLAAKLWSQ